MGRIMQAFCRHSWEFVSCKETGKLCFSFDCARPQIEIIRRCEACGKEKTGLAMSGTKWLPLTPEVAGRVLRDEFGHQHWSDRFKWKYGQPPVNHAKEK